MKLITAIIQPDKLDDVREALIRAEITRISVSRCTGHGRQENTEIYRGQVVVPNLRNKVFTLDADNHRARNVYVWRTEAAARAFFTDELVERVTGLYGVRPQVEYAEILELVDNADV